MRAQPKGNSERQADPYWPELHALGEAIISRDERHQLYLQVHTSEESYGGANWGATELDIKLCVPRGVRQYVHARPCILVPRIILTVALSQSASEIVAPSQACFGERVGKVIDSEVEGMERRGVGNAQAWYYPEDKLLVLWECEVFPSWRRKSSRADDDPILPLVWHGFESLLLEKFTDAERIVTPSWEPNYERDDWQAFLRSFSYARQNDNLQAYVKESKP